MKMEEYALWMSDEEYEIITKTMMYMILICVPPLGITFVVYTITKKLIQLIFLICNKIRRKKT